MVVYKRVVLKFCVEIYPIWRMEQGLQFVLIVAICTTYLARVCTVHKKDCNKKINIISEFLDKVTVSNSQLDDVSSDINVLQTFSTCLKRQR